MKQHCQLFIIAAISLIPGLAGAQFSCELSNQPVNAVIWAGCSATFTLSQTGAPPKVCEWWFNDFYKSIISWAMARRAFPATAG